MKNILTKIIIVANILIIIGMLVTGFADILDPRTWGYLSMAGYTFPVFAILNIVFILIWMLTKIRYVLIPFVGFVMCYYPVRKYCPFNIGGDAPEGSLKVMTFNTWAYGRPTIDIPYDEAVTMRRELFRYIADLDCDVVCFQEAVFDKIVEQDLDSIIKPVMPYWDHSVRSGSTILILSKYPIVRQEKIDYESVANLSSAFWLDVNGKELIVINNHLETNHFSTKEKETFGEMIKGKMEKNKMKGESKNVVKKLTDAAEIRAYQADAIASFVNQHKGSSMIVCGDFNDIPISYTHRTIAKNLKDCYISSANGPGYTYNKNGMYVRIDNMLCSEDMAPYGCHVDKTCKISDHFPIIGWVKWDE